jgi:lysozyme
MTTTPGIDVSRWQGAINWVPIAAAGYRFAVIRATVGNHYTDPRFYENWRGATENGLLVSAYHVVKPKQSADSQIDRLFEVLEDRTSDLPLVLDVELTDDKDAATITRVVKECADEIEKRDGRKPIIYTGSWFWTPNVHHTLDWDVHDLWIAHYGVSKPTLPDDWSEWHFWQHSETGSVKGVSSHNTDLDWFNGSYDDLLAYAGREVPPPEHETHKDEDADEEVDASTVTPPHSARSRARVTNEFLRVRSGPGVNYTHLRDLAQGDEVEILDIEGKEVWVAIGPGEWVALAYKGARYLEVTDS